MDYKKRLLLSGGEFVPTQYNMWGFGSNYYGQLATGYLPDHTVFNKITTETDIRWKQIDTNDYDLSFGVATDGTLWGWGINYFQLLGPWSDPFWYDSLHSLDDSVYDKPIQIGTDNDWSFVSCYRMTFGVIALKTDGTLWSWGIGSGGQLGQGDTLNRTTPTKIGTDTDWAKCYTGRLGSYAIKTDGSLYTWNSSYLSPTIVNSYNWFSVNSNGSVTIGIKEDDRTLWWLPPGTLPQTPIQISTDAWKSVSPVDDRYDLSPRIFQLFAIKEDGSLWQLSLNYYTKELTASDQFTGSPDGLDYSWSSINNKYPYGRVDYSVDPPVYYYPSLIALKTNGTLWTWGNNREGALGLGDTVYRDTPTKVGSDSDWYYASSYGDCSFAIKSDGTAWVAGVNVNQISGIYTDNTTSISKFLDNSGIDYIKEVSVGVDFVLAIRIDGTLWCWGNNQYGQLGIGTVDPSVSYLFYYNPTARNRVTPIQIVDTSPASANNDWLKITNNNDVRSGYGFSLALKSDGTLWSWGYNYDGQLGLGDTTDRYLPTQVGVDNDWIDIATNYASSYALKTDGTLWSWGSNASGFLGLGDTVNRTSPAQIGIDDDWNKCYTTGSGAAFARKNDGSLWSWGTYGYYFGQYNDTPFRMAPGEKLQSIEPISSTIIGSPGLTPIIPDQLDPEWYDPSDLTVYNFDAFWTINLTFPITFLGETYNTIYVSTGGYITFGMGVYGQSGLESLPGPKPPRIQIMGRGVCQNLYYVTEGSAPTRTFRIVFEGSSTNAWPETTIIWEATFYEQYPSQIDIKVNSTDPYGLVNDFTNEYASNYSGYYEFGIYDSVGRIDVFDSRENFLANFYSYSTNPFSSTGGPVNFGIRFNTNIDSIKPSTIENISSNGYSYANTFVKTDGTMWGSGDGYNLGVDSKVFIPKQIGNLTSDWKSAYIVSNRSGTYNNCAFAIKTDGTVWRWGSAINWEFFSHTIINSFPTKVEELSNIYKLSLGGEGIFYEYDSGIVAIALQR